MSTQIKVWDPLLRAFHWILASAFFIAYFTEEDLLTPHVWAGYTVLAMLAFRLVWGFTGPRHARFSDFMYSPSKAIAYLKDAVYMRAKRYIGHNPAGAIMIFIMIFSLLATSLTGLAVYAAEEHAGPLAPWLGSVGEHWEDIFEETHEFLANFTLFLVFLHLGGVALESLVHKENLVRAMITGYKRQEKHS